MTPPEDNRSLVDDLVSDLTPVRRFPSLRMAVLGMALVFVPTVAIVEVVHQPGVDLVAKLTTDPWFAAVVLGLVVGAFGAGLAGFAGLVPGREAVERPALWTALAGLGGAVLAAGAATLFTADAGATHLQKDVACFMLGAGVGLVPAAAVIVLHRWGFVRRPERAAALALIAAFGLGGLSVQLVCHYPGARHMLFGHVGVPVFMLVLGFGPMLLLLRRFANRFGS